MLSLFKYIPQDLTGQDVSCAITCYDGNNEMPYCDLVYAGLSVLQKYLKKRSEYDEWRKGNLPEVSEGVYLNIPQTFNLDQIAESGQCFRMTPIQNGGYVVVNGVHVVKITPHESCGYVFTVALMSLGIFGFPISTFAWIMQSIKRKWPKIRFCRKQSKWAAGLEF